MKRILMAVILLLALCTCASAEDVIRLGGLKGPTSMGMVHLLDEAEQGRTEVEYDFVMAGSADELTPKLIQGELDVLAVPANLGSILYNRTQGNIRFLAVNTLGVLYIVEKGDEIHSFEDLKGKTIFATGKGSTPEYALAYLLEKHGMSMDADVTVEWKSEPTEAVAAMQGMDNAIAMLPQPFVTVAQTQIEGLHIVLDLTEEWDKIGESQLITAGLIARSAFVEEHPDVIEKFLEEYKASTAFANEHVEETAELVEKYGIVKAAIAMRAIPYCNIVYEDGSEMKDNLSGYLSVLFAQNPASVGGALPGDDFYYDR